MRHGTALLLACCSACAALAGSPAEAVAAAVADAHKLPAEVRRDYRYLSLYAIPEKEREAFEKALVFHFHCLSREPEVVPLVKVTPDLIRVYFLDYGWDRSVWEKLSTREPYFHYLDTRVIRKVAVDVTAPVVVVEEVVKVFVFRSGTGQMPVSVPTSEVRPGEKVYEQVGERSFRETSMPVARKSATPAKRDDLKEEQSVKPLHAPWLDAKQIGELALLLNSDCPIVRADWFLYQTGGTFRRGGAGYYEFLGLKSIRDAEKLAGLDIEAARRIRREMAAIVEDSGVALNNRQILWFKTLAGSWWQTLDVSESTGKKNALRLLDGDFEGEAFEIYFSLPSGTWGLLAVNAADGTLQEKVPDDIATNHVSPTNDKRIQSGFSCIECHSEGIKNIDDWARATYTGPVALAARDPKKLKRLKQLYLSDLPKQIRNDQRDYAEVVLKINGLKPEDNAKGYSLAYRNYFDRRLTFEALCYEIPADAVAFKKKLEAYALPGDADPVLTAQLARLKRPMRREHFEECFSLAQTIWNGGKP